MPDSPVTPLPAGSSIRIRVNDPVLGSGSSWKINSRPETQDVYIEHIEGGRWMHASLHQSGQNHHALTKAARESSGWTAPRQIAKEPESWLVSPGIRHASRILIARTELDPAWQEIGTPTDVTDVPLVPGYDATAIDTYLLDPNVDFPVFSTGSVIARLIRGGVGGEAVVVVHGTNLDVPVHEGLADLIDDATAKLIGQGLVLPTRIVAISQDPEMPGLQRETEVLLKS